MHTKTALKDHRRITSAHDLLRNGLIWDGDFAAMESVSERYAIGLNAHLADLIKANPAANGVRAQFVPDERELYATPTELIDPIGDAVHSPVKGIVHRYPDRVLFKAVSACAVYCRYCFRREMVGPVKGESFNHAERMAALDYIRTHKEIWEVILTGGDPFVLSARQMGDILAELSAIEHVQVIRIHTRVPVSDPARMTDEYVQTLKNKCTKPLYIVLHTNHPDELNETAADAITRLHAIGATLLSQSVLLRGVNDHAGTLERLLRKLITLHVKPYYLHHPDMAKGTSHFRLPLKDGIAIYKALLGRVSGLCQPSYMLDIPGGFGKIPINANYIEELGNGHYLVEDYQGNRHNYMDDPHSNAKRADL